MGWDFVKSKVGNDLKSLDTFFDNEFDCVGKGHIHGDEYYRAIRDGAGISCVVCHVDWRQMDGAEWFGYKAISEYSGPVANHCPDRILDMLTPTKNEFAQQWRKECRENNQKERELGQETFLSKSQWGLVKVAEEFVKKNDIRRKDGELMLFNRDSEDKRKALSSWISVLEKRGFSRNIDKGNEK